LGRYVLQVMLLARTKVVNNYQEVSFSKNWVFPGGSLIFDRWKQVLQKGFPMVELITWNDYGESHYIGPLSSPHFDDGNSKWTNDL